MFIFIEKKYHSLAIEKKVKLLAYLPNFKVKGQLLQKKELLQ